MKIKKFRKKLLILILIILFLISSTLLFFFLFIKEKQDTSWYDSNWSYRKSMYIQNIPKEYKGLTEDVLIELDTETLISEEKLQNNCQDIRFIDPDTKTLLPYWIEGGCNTQETQIWINVILSESSSKTIYMYYGNKQAPDNQEPWNGEFISMSLDDCNNNWSLEGDFSGRFILSGKTFGYTGGLETHSHDLFLYSGESCTDPISVGISSDEPNCDPKEENILISTTNQFSNIPEYENVNFCSSKNGYLNSTSIILLNTNSTTENLDHVSIFDDKYPRGENNQKLETLINHIHTISCINTYLPLSDRTIKYLSLNKETDTIVTQIEPPYYTMNFLTKASGGSIPTNSIMMVSSIPPLGWEYFEDAENKFIKGSSGNFGSTGGEESHSHVFNADISIKSTSEENLIDINTTNICLLETIDNSITTTEDVSLPPYMTIILAQKKDNLIGVENIILGLEEYGEVLGTTGSGPSQPTELKTEGQTDPQYITDTTPEFTAKFNHPDYP